MGKLNYKISPQLRTQAEVRLEEDTVDRLFKQESRYIFRDPPKNRVVIPFSSLRRILENNVLTLEYVMAVLKKAPNCWKNDWRKTRHKVPHLSCKTSKGTLHETLTALMEARRCFEHWHRSEIQS